MRKYLLPFFLVLADVLTMLIVAFLSLFLRFDSIVFNEYFMNVLYSLPCFVSCYLLMLGFMHMYTRIWRYAGIREVGSILFATTAASLLYWISTMVMEISLPRSFFFISYILMTGAIGFSRLLLHYIILMSDRERIPTTDQVPVLIIGAGDAGATIAREIVRFHAQYRRLIGFIDDDDNKCNHLLHGLPILGNRTVLPDIVGKYGIKEIIIAIPSAPQSVIREIVRVCAPLKCKIKILPGIYQMLNGDVLVQRLRPVAIDDLLQRDEIHLNTKQISQYLEGKCILVSGAGGSIGSEICRQIICMKPARLILLGHGENSIYTIHQELREIFDSEKLVPVIASVRDPQQMHDVFEKYRPQVVFHAAAHKHVPLMEIQPMAAIWNNVFGTRNIARAAGIYGVERFVMISTDKAVNPTSVMGATKQVAEKVIQVMSHRYDTKYITVRFGNVLGSRGSVIPLFRKQLAAGGPLTVTDPEMTRYFMTIPEASQLVLQAGSMGRGGEVFLLDMGEPVKIMDLAENMIRLSGLEPGVDMEIKITGIRPGEKLYEELLTAGEGTRRTNHKKIFTARLDPVDDDVFCKQILSFEKCHGDNDVLDLLQQIIPNYHPNHDPQAKQNQRTISQEEAV